MSQPAASSRNRLLAIGDIHGCATAFRTLTDFARIGPDDVVVTLGDYINRGPDTKGVVDQLLALAHRTTLVPLMGNHERMLLAALQSRSALIDWLACGGEETLQSYGAKTWDDLPVAHLEFIRQCRLVHETATHVFVHANLDPFTPVEAQGEEALLWRHLEEEPVPHVSGKTMICGHTPQRTGLPTNFGHTVCIDTDAQRGGWLTCLDVLSGRYWQANESTQTRADVLEFTADSNFENAGY